MVVKNKRKDIRMDMELKRNIELQQLINDCCATADRIVAKMRAFNEKERQRDIELNDLINNSRKKY